MSSQQQQAPKKQKGFLANLAFNIIIPVVILSKFNGEDSLGPMWSIVVALAFPILYGIWELKDSGKVNPMSILGIVSVFLTGGISLLKLDPKYIAIKEATIPALIGIMVILSQRSRYPLVNLFLFNEQVIDVAKVKEIIRERGLDSEFASKLRNVSYIIASSFFLSSVLNYVLAKWIMVSPAGTEAYTEELAKMTALSYPVIALPSMVVLFAGLWYMMTQLKNMTGLKMEEMLVGQHQESQPE
ncbi:VC0807 family protein [Gynuella sp.]|uniref:VC0807 family protein n=1 Tax=Gynuella sp. TaxID=2969146 RepID=UPI003D149384